MDRNRSRTHQTHNIDIINSLLTSSSVHTVSSLRAGSHLGHTRERQRAKIKSDPAERSLVRRREINFDFRSLPLALYCKLWIPVFSPIIYGPCALCLGHKLKG